jgi:hypothetical protein
MFPDVLGPSEPRGYKLEPYKPYREARVVDFEYGRLLD